MGVNRHPLPGMSTCVHLFGRMRDTLGHARLRFRLEPTGRHHTPGPSPGISLQVAVCLPQRRGHPATRTNVTKGIILVAEKTIRATITVTLASGSVRVHTYEVPATKAAVKEWTESKVSWIARVLVTRKAKAFGVSNPTTIYNCDHVASVTYEYTDSEEYRKFLADLTPNEAQMGFKA